MEVFSKGVVVTITLFPLLREGKRNGWRGHGRSTFFWVHQHSAPVVPPTPPAHLQDELHHLSVHQPMHRLSVDMGDEVSCTQAGFMGWTSFLHVLPRERQRLGGKKQTVRASQDCCVALNPMAWPLSPTLVARGSLTRKAHRQAYPDNVVDAVDITVAHVHSDGTQREAILLP